MSRTYNGAAIDPEEEAVLVTRAGSVRTNGRYYRTDRTSVEGVVMYRKVLLGEHSLRRCMFSAWH